ncbi:MAG: hypothetical protein ACI4I6_00070 [Hominimerdicola sp.]
MVKIPNENICISSVISYFIGRHSCMGSFCPCFLHSNHIVFEVN